MQTRVGKIYLTILNVKSALWISLRAQWTCSLKTYLTTLLKEI